MIAILASLMPLLDSLFGGIIQPLVKSWTDYKLAQLQTMQAGMATAETADSSNLQTIQTAEIQNNALKIQVYGAPTYRIISMWVGGVCALHFTLVFIDTILASKFLYGRSILGVPDAPGQYPLYEWMIISSFFLVHAVNIGTSNVSAWLNKKA